MRYLNDEYLDIYDQEEQEISLLKENLDLNLDINEVLDFAEWKLEQFDQEKIYANVISGN